MRPEPAGKGTSRTAAGATASRSRLVLRSLLCAPLDDLLQLIGELKEVHVIGVQPVGVLVVAFDEDHLDVVGGELHVVPSMVRTRRLVG